MDIFSLLILPLVVAAGIAFALTPLVIKLAWKLNIIDDPKKNKHPKVIHSKPTPRAGGLALFIAILVPILIFLPLDKHLLGIIAGAAVILVVGLIDDMKNLSPYKRLPVQFFAASLPIAAGIGIAFITNPFNGIVDLSQPRINFELFGEIRSIWVLSDLFALFWIVTLMNFVNIGANGVDGQLSGTVAISAIVIALLSLQFSADISQWPIIILASITAGAYLGFLPWHVFPQKIMPGFSGATLAGFLLGVLSILSTTKVGTLLVVLAVPLIDTGYTIVRRIMSGKTPFWGDRGHLHHRLLDMGWSKKKVSSFYWIVTAVLGTLALYLNAHDKLYTIIGVSLLTGGLIIWLTYRSKLSR